MRNVIAATVIGSFVAVAAAAVAFARIVMVRAT